VNARPPAPLVEASGLSRTYRMGASVVPAVQNISLSIAPGEFVALKGPSGSGKTTLLNLLGLLDRPDAGVVRIEGKDGEAISEDERSDLRRDRFGFVFQTFNLIPVLTAEENVAYPMALAGLAAQARRDRARELLASVGLAEKVGVRPDQLSGGQRQRVSIARALANGPSGVFADEPHGRRDPRPHAGYQPGARGRIPLRHARRARRVAGAPGRDPPRRRRRLGCGDMSAFALAWRNIVRQKRRSFLMIAVVGLGFAAFALAGGFIAQSFEGLKEGTIRSVGDLQVVDRRAVGKAEEATLEYGLPEAKRARALAAADPDVSAVLPRIDFVGLATTGAKSVPFLGVGVDAGPAAAVTLAPELIASGKYLAGDGGDGVLLGTGLAAALNVKPGDRVTLMATTPDGSLNALDGIVQGLADVRIKELNDRYVAAGIGLVSRLLQSSETVTKLVVFLKPGAKEDRVAARIEKAFQAGGYTVAVRHWRELATFYEQVKLLYIGIFGFVGTVLVIIVILSAAIVMTMAVTERTREIGTLRAIGTRPSGILRMFLAEGVVIALAGCAAGMVLALVVRAALNASGIVLPPPPGATHGMPINVKLYPLAYAAGVAAMLLTMTIASYFPARRASRVPIVDALTHV